MCAQKFRQSKMCFAFGGHWVDCGPLEVVAKNLGSGVVCGGFHGRKHCACEKFCIQSTITQLTIICAKNDERWKGCLATEQTPLWAVFSSVHLAALRPIFQVAASFEADIVCRSLEVTEEIRLFWFRASAKASGSRVDEIKS